MVGGGGGVGVGGGRVWVFNDEMGEGFGAGRRDVGVELVYGGVVRRVDCLRREYRHGAWRWRGIGVVAAEVAGLDEGGFDVEGVGFVKHAFDKAFNGVLGGAVGS